MRLLRGGKPRAARLLFMCPRRRFALPFLPIMFCLEASMLHRPRRLRALRLCLLTLAACLILPLALSGATPSNDPAAVVGRAWGLAGASGSYTYSASIEQTSYPAPSLTSPGREPRVERVALEGSIDTPNQALELSLWRGADRNPARAHSLRMADGRVEQRAGLGDWRPTGGQRDRAGRQPAELPQRRPRLPAGGQRDPPVRHGRRRGDRPDPELPPLPV
jgi:hypothetical protein